MRIGPETTSAMITIIRETTSGLWPPFWKMGKRTGRVQCIPNGINNHSVNITEQRTWNYSRFTAAVLENGWNQCQGPKAVWISQETTSSTPKTNLKNYFRFAVFILENGRNKQWWKLTKVNQNLVSKPCQARGWAVRCPQTYFVKFGKHNKKYFSGGMTKFGEAWPTLDVVITPDFLECSFRLNKK